MSYGVAVLLLVLTFCINHRFFLFWCFLSGKVAKEVMEQSAKIKRDPPEIHRSEFLLKYRQQPLKWSEMWVNSDLRILCICTCGHMGVCLCPGLAWCQVGAVLPSPTALDWPVCPGPDGERCTSPSWKVKHTVNKIEKYRKNKLWLTVTGVSPQALWQHLGWASEQEATSLSVKQVLVSKPAHSS